MFLSWTVSFWPIGKLYILIFALSGDVIIPTQEVNSKKEQEPDIYRLEGSTTTSLSIWTSKCLRQGVGENILNFRRDAIEKYLYVYLWSSDLQKQFFCLLKSKRIKYWRTNKTKNCDKNNCRRELLLQKSYWRQWNTRLYKNHKESIAMRPHGWQDDKLS